MFGNLGEMAGLMKKAKDMKANIAKMKEEIAASEFYGTCPDNKVSVVISGDFQVRRIKIAPDAAGNTEMLEDAVKTAVNSAVSSAQCNIREKMQEITGGLNIPGLF
ncbi:MAG: YbaB/EbfC family nucleoid-associated protein [Victivallaceae bacterium]|nr:YbaB/EbfC family nucleoid-associated protein [Victivallaceae bacterium]